MRTNVTSEHNGVHTWVTVEISTEDGNTVRHSVRAGEGKDPIHTAARNAYQQALVALRQLREARIDREA